MKLLRSAARVVQQQDRKVSAANLHDRITLLTVYFSFYIFACSSSHPVVNVETMVNLNYEEVCPNEANDKPK